MNALQINHQPEIQSALYSLPSHDAHLWLKMGAAIYSELSESGFDIWNEWSATAPNYQEKAARQAWKSFNTGTKTRIGSLFYEARTNGWKPSQPYNPLTPEQRALIEAEYQAANREAQKRIADQQATAAKRALDKLNQANTVNTQHPYVINKGITPYGAKQLFNDLILPISSGGKVVNVQRISPNGEKRFGTGGQIKGASLLLGWLKGAGEAILCEGWATGCTLHQATKLPVIVAFTAGNLPIIAERLATALPEMKLRICGDNDASGTGQMAAQQAAKIHPNAQSCIPFFTSEQSGTDFNDLYQIAGQEEVRLQVLSHKEVETADMQPEPFINECPAIPWPSDCLPQGLQAAVDSIASHVQAPQALAGMAVLSAVAHITQRLVDVERPNGGAMPTSLFILSLAGSGERKSECFRRATQPIYQAETQAREQYRQRIKQLAAESKHSKKAAKKEKGEQDIEAPTDPRTLFSDTTMEGIAKAFVADSQPALTLATDEGGQFFGGHSMTAETRANSCSMLTKLFDGGGVDRQRASAESGSGFRAGVRFGVFLSAQPIVVAKSLSDPLLQGQGLLPRFLLSAPESLVGTRLVTVTQLSVKAADDPALTHYWDTLSRMNNTRIQLDKNEQLAPHCYMVDGEALKLWIDFYNETESSNSRHLVTTAFLSRAGELVRRVAAVLACYRAFDALNLNGVYSYHTIDLGSINVDDMRGAIALVRYSLAEWESQLNRSSASLSPLETDAYELLKWLQSKGANWYQFTRSQLGQFAPNKLRSDTDRRKAAIDELIRRGWLSDDEKKLTQYCPPAVAVSAVSAVSKPENQESNSKIEIQTANTANTATASRPFVIPKTPPASQHHEDWLESFDAEEVF